MTALCRSLVGETHKLKRTLALWLALLTPGALVFLEVAAATQQQGNLIKPDVNGWLTMFEHMFSIWMRHFPADQRDTVRSYVLDRRREFVAKLLGPEAIPPDLPPIERLNSSSALSIAAQKPDFDLPQWDTVRDYFREDLKEFEKLAAECGVSMEFVTTERLHRHLD